MELNRHNMRRILLLLFAAISLFLGLQNLGVVLNAIKIGLGLLTPFIIGIAMAFFLYVPLQMFEKRVFFTDHKVVNAIRRPISILLSILLIGAVIFVVLVLLIPQISESIEVLTRAIPGFFRNLPEWMDQFTKRFPHFNQWLLQNIHIDWNRVGNSAMDWVRSRATGFLGSTISAITYVFGLTFNLVVAFVFAIYLLSSKEKLARQVKGLLYAYLPESRADRIIYIGNLTRKTFYQFVTGQMLEAVIIGLLCFIGMLILRIPFAPIASILVFITSFIPLFGAFIGTGLAAFIIMMESPVKALWFIIFIIVLQQFEGNVIYPRLMGKSIGLPAIWILFAVTMGGAAFGIVGMLLAVPFVSIIYTLLKEAVNNRLEQKEISDEKLS